MADDEILEEVIKGVGETAGEIALEHMLGPAGAVLTPVGLIHRMISVIAYESPKERARRLAAFEAKRQAALDPNWSPDDSLIENPILDNPFLE